MPPNNFSLFGNGNNRRQNRNQNNGFNNQNMNNFGNMQQGGQMNQNHNQLYNRQMQNAQRNNQRPMQNQQPYPNMPMQNQQPYPNMPVQNQQPYPNMPQPQQNQMMMPNQNGQQDQIQQFNQNGNMNQQMMPIEQNQNQQPHPQSMNQLPDLSQLPVFDPLAGQTPVNAQLPVPQNSSPISFEHLDEKTMAEVQRLINEKRLSEGLPIAAPESPAPTNMLPVTGIETVSNEPDEKLREFIQSERNASEFYKYLSEIATKDEYSRILDNISSESIRRSEELNSIYQTLYGKAYEIKKSKVNNSIRFKDGLNWALNVENRSLREISDYYANMNSHSNDDTHSKKINCVIHKKICDLNYLQTMYTNTKAFF